MGNDGPDGGHWATPGQPAPESPPGAPTGGGGWPTGPPPPPYGWGPNAVPLAPRPGVIPLRPLGVGELLDGAFTTIRRYPAATLGMAAVIMFFVEVVQVIATYYLLHGVDLDVTTNSDGTLSTGAGDLFARTSTLDLAVVVVAFVATILLSGMLAPLIGEGALGRPMSASQAWRATRASLRPLLGATGAIFLVLIGIFAVGILPGVVIGIAGAHDAGVALAVLGGLASGVAVVYVTTLLVFTTPALMLEKQGIKASMSRSRALVRGSWWRVFGIIALATVIATVIAGIIGVPFAAAGGSFSGILSGHPQNHFGFTELLVTGIGGLIGAILVRPFTAGVIALLYLDRRMRAEALDLTLQQAAANPSS
jgi:hypothetical protein